MRYFRIFEAMPGRSPLGYGLAGARWNKNGIPIIYACSNSSLNFLEMLTIKGPMVTHSSWLLAAFDIEGDIPYILPEDLPEDWVQRPYPQSTQEVGAAWVRSMISPFLKIPSCRIPLSSYPEEHNLLINPIHEDTMRRLKVLETENVSFELNSWR